MKSHIKFKCENTIKITGAYTSSGECSEEHPDVICLEYRCFGTNDIIKLENGQRLQIIGTPLTQLRNSRPIGKTFYYICQVDHDEVIDLEYTKIGCVVTLDSCNESFR